MENNNTELATFNTRPCSYAPQKNLIEISYENSNTKELYLEVKYRVQWFQQYCFEHGLEGYIDDSDIKYAPDAQMFIATASVYIDNKLVGRSTAGVSYSANDANSSKVAVQTAATFAKGRALANAGFGTINCQMEEGEKFPCDSGIKVISNPNNPMEVQLIPTKSRSTNITRGQKTTSTSLAPKPMAPEKENKIPVVKETNETPVVEETIYSLEEAKAVVVPFGQHKGKTFGEVLAVAPNIVDFYASDKFDNPKHQYLKSAAKVIVANKKLA